MLEGNGTCPVEEGEDDKCVGTLDAMMMATKGNSAREN